MIPQGLEWNLALLHSQLYDLGLSLTSPNTASMSRVESVKPEES